MRKLILSVLVLVLFTVNAHAAIYIISADGKYNVKTTLAAAATDPQGAGKTVVVTSPLSAVQSNISSSTVHSWPTDRKLKFDSGGSIANTTKFSITKVYADRDYIFKGSGRVFINDCFPEYWGAKNDGVTDCGPGFRLAMKSGASNIYLDSGTYYFSTYDTTVEWSKDEYSLFWLETNTSLLGSGKRKTVIKMSSFLPPLVISQKGASCRINFIGIKKASSNTEVRDMSFDAGGFIVPPSPAPSYVSSNIVIVGGDHCTLENLYARDIPGYNYIMIGYHSLTWTTYNYAPQNTTIRGCTLVNGSKAVTGNVNAMDCSFIYDNGDYTLIEKNEIGNETANADPFWCGGVELHGNYSVVYDNTFMQGLNPSIYVGRGIGYGIGYGYKIDKNTFQDNNSGIWMISEIQGIEITRNRFIGNTITNSNIFATRDDTTGVSGAVKNKIVISGNTFDQGSLTSNKYSVKLPWCTNVTVTDNHIIGYRVFLTISGASDGTSDTILVTNNDMIAIPSGAFSGGLITVGDSVSWSYTIQNVLVRNNSILATSSTTNFYKLIAGYSGAQTPTISNVVCVDTQVTGAVSEKYADTQEYMFTENFTFTPALVASVTPGTGTYDSGYQQGYGFRRNGIVYFTIKLKWSAHTGSGTMRIIGLPFTAPDLPSNMPVSIFYSDLVSAAGKQVTGIFNKSPVNGISLYQQDPAGGSTTLINLDTAGYIILTGWYPII